MQYVVRKVDRPRCGYIYQHKGFEFDFKSNGEHGYNNPGDISGCHETTIKNYESSVWSLLL